MRASQERGYILHTYNYRESSLIVEAFTGNYGRISLVAKGVRRWKKKGSRTYLRPFQEFSLSWTGKGEMATLTVAEEILPIQAPGKEALYCGFYVNELLMRLLYRHDPHEQLYGWYKACLNELAQGGSMESALRLFEKRLLLEIGYGLNLDTDISSGTPVEADGVYGYVPNQGPSSGANDPGGLNQCVITGKSLLAYQNESILDPAILAELKNLMRRLIDHQLNYKPLASRNIFIAGAGRNLKLDASKPGGHH